MVEAIPAKVREEISTNVAVLSANGTKRMQLATTMENAITLRRLPELTPPPRVKYQSLSLPRAMQSTTAVAYGIAVTRPLFSRVRWRSC
ncbi:hypothetical protein D9M71_734700 [compost metagenome]